MIGGEKTSHLFVAAIADHLLEQIAGQKRDVRWALGQAAHQIRVPLSSKGNVHTHPVAFANKAVLQITSNPVKHLEFVARRRYLILPDKPLRLSYDRLVV